jgi:subtilisin family serine protease
VARNSLLYATTASWGIDRVDQANLPLDYAYTPEFTGCGVEVYVMDTGLDTDAADFADTGNVRARED